MTFVKGISGNPSGRPKVLAGVLELAQTHTPSAVRTLATIMEDKKAPPAARVAAALGLLRKTVPDLSSKELTIKKPLEGLSEHELIDLLDTIRQLKAGRVANDGGIATPADTRH